MHVGIEALRYMRYTRYIRFTGARRDRGAAGQHALRGKPPQAGLAPSLDAGAAADARAAAVHVPGTSSNRQVTGKEAASNRRNRQVNRRVHVPGAARDDARLVD